MPVLLPLFHASPASQRRRRPQRLHRVRQCAVAVVLLTSAPLSAPADDLLAEAFALEQQATTAAWSLARLERALLAPDDDQLVILFSVPLGAPVVLEAIRVRIDGGSAVDHHFTGFELERFLDGAVQRLYMTRLPAGEHHIQVMVNVIAGGVKQDAGYTFIKGERVKFVLVALNGLDYRRVQITDW